MASTREWFETVEEARRRAKRRLPKPVYMALVAGTEKGVTLQDNLTRVQRTAVHAAAHRGPAGQPGNWPPRSSGKRSPCR